MEKKKNPILIIVCIIIAIIILFVVFKVFNKNEQINSNSSSSSNSYSSKDVAYTCVQNIEQNGNKGTLTADVVFNDNGYQTTIYYTMVINYAEMDDEKMLSLLQKVDPYGGTKTSPNYENFNVNGTTKLGIVDDFGMDTTVTRNGNTVTYTYYVDSYNNYQQLTSSDKEDLKEAFKSQGFSIK